MIVGKLVIGASVFALTPKQIAALKKLSAASGAPVQHYLRLAVDQFLAKKKPAKR